MQTFLPYADIKRSAMALDDRRLGKQRVEARQILETITDDDGGGGWRNHPAVRMWRGYPEALKAYVNECIREWVRRGFRNSMDTYEVPEPYELPPWFGDEALHSSHRANLLRKDPEHYGRYDWDEDPGAEYVWPG